MAADVKAAAAYREYNFDGLVGPTHNYGGLSIGNVASMSHEGAVSNPRQAALEGLAKMRFVHALGVGQGVLPPHERPSLVTLRRLGFAGSDEEVLIQAAAHSDDLVRQVSSAAPMWVANAATVAPSCDTADGLMHVTPANLSELFHRSIEAQTTERVMRVVFSDASKFAVHAPLPEHFADEGAANHTRLAGIGLAAVHVFAWGRSGFGETPLTRRFPARQTREASEALARLHRLDPERVVYVRQHPKGIDAGAFHTDVLAVGSGGLLMLHELAFSNQATALARMRSLLGASLRVEVATEAEFPLVDAIASYAFNSQLVALGDGSMVLLAPEESRDNPRARLFLERVASLHPSLRRIDYLSLRQSMQNGGGPACLRLRFPLAEAEVAALGARILFSPALGDELEAWVVRHYRDRLAPADLRDPRLARESFTALDELTRILELGSIYDFQRG